MISEDDMQHGRPWKGEKIEGWFASEKLDGCRLYWDGARGWTRSGRIVPLPKEWTAKLPKMHLEGEIYAGRGQFEITVNAVVRNRWAPTVCFMVFDAPQVEGCWSKRIAAAKKHLRCGFAACVPSMRLDDLVHLSLFFRQIRQAGGEGVIVRRPGASYSKTGTGDVLKVKACPITGELRWQERRAQFR